MNWSHTETHASQFEHMQDLKCSLTGGLNKRLTLAFQRYVNLHAREQRTALA